MLQEYIVVVRLKIVRGLYHFSETKLKFFDFECAKPVAKICDIF
jgi:hypothetical protein